MFTSPVDIANRALQYCGAKRISGFTDDSVNAQECNFAYDKVRRAELRRNVWRFATRRTALRAIDTTTMLVTPTLWSSTTTYFIGSLATTSDGAVWISNAPNNLNNSPGTAAQWELYFGPLTADVYDSTTTYHVGELVYKAPGDGTYTAFLALVDGASEDPAVADAYDATVTYMKGQVVTYSSANYQSLVDLNTNNQPNISSGQWTVTLTEGSGSLQWQGLAVSLSSLSLFWPVGSGPLSNATSRNVYRLPANFLRVAPQDPKAGSVSYLGAPSGLTYRDWEYEGNYLVTRDAFPMIFRFVADISTVTAMDDMFCEGLACRLALAVSPRLTQSNMKQQEVQSEYKVWMGDARTVNGIETGPVEPEEDDFVSCRR